MGWDLGTRCFKMAAHVCLGRHLYIRKTLWQYVILPRFLCQLTTQSPVDDHFVTEDGQLSPTEVIPQAFIVLPKVQKLDLKKNSWLTKTALHLGLPQQFKDFQKLIPDEELVILRKSFKNSVLQKFGFQKEEVKRRSFVEEEISLGILQEFLRSCFTHFYSTRVTLPHLRESFLDRNPQVITHWIRRSIFYQIKDNPAYILWTRYPINLLDEEPEVTNGLPIPGPYRTLELGVYKHSFVPLKNNPGCRNRQQNLFPYSHTMFLTCVNQTVDQMQAYGIISMFSILVSHALDEGNKLGDQLAKPLATKCIVTDGVKFVFMCYQLNTLDLETDTGIRNVAWTTDCMDLFRKRAHNASKKKALLYESVAAGSVLPKFNEECFQNFVSFLSHRTL